MNDSRTISWMHAALILSKHLSAGSASANSKLREALLNQGTIADIFNYYFSIVQPEPDIESALDKAYNKIKFDFHAVTIRDPEYPESLKQVENASPILYCRGDISLLKEPRTMAFVGTRELNNPAHISHGDQVIARLIKSGCSTIVSGLAEGSDTLGHTSAIKHGGRTIAVLGTPLDKYFPKENKALQEEIASQHLLISEYPIGIRSFGPFFANRNRTTVGLATEGVVVARAGDRSGTQYAIRHCVEQEKQLYALENNIHEREYTWVHKYKNKIKVIR